MSESANDKDTQATAQTAQETAGEGTSDVYPFQTEMQQLLQILIHSLYAERDVFLRELVSNAADAINKLKFHTLTDTNVRDPEATLEITLETDAEGKALIVSDTGIGMTREEAIANLGTIARSGTLEFVKQLSATDPGQRAELIGQFGVGFYSVFMVARRVVVDSCPADPAQPGVRWVSEGQGDYTVGPTERTHRGTSIRVELKDDAEDFCQPDRVESIVQRYSTFVPHPIRLEARRLNVQEAIWAQPKSQVNDEQYTEFFKYLTHGTEGPLRTLHLSIDAPVQFQALLFLPQRLTNEVLYSPTGFGLELYANKVLIKRDAQELLPLYLRFLRGVVDSQDLQLNVSRETIQNNPLVDRLRTTLTGRVLRELKALAESEPETYRTFWQQYGMVFKEGIPSDQANRERLVELLRFNSSHGATAEDLTSLADYVARMKPEQKEILYYTGPSREAIERNPHLEYFRKQGLEVLYLTDQVDDFVMANLWEYEGKRLASIDQADLESLKDEEAAAPEPAVSAEALAGLQDYLKTTLGERVTEVRSSKRLVDSPAVLVSADGMPGNLAKVMKMLGQEVGTLPKILEVNPAHPLVAGMARLHQQEAASPVLHDLAEQLFDNCLLTEGLLEHPERMVSRIQALMARAVGEEAAPAASDANPGTPAADEAADAPGDSDAAESDSR